MAEPEKIEALLKRRGQQLREQLAAPLLDELRHAVGLRDLSSAGDIASEDAGVARVAPPLFKQYREKDGRFYFKLTAGDGTLLIQSEGFDSPRDAGQLIAVIKQAEQGDQLQSELFKREAEVDAVRAALAALRDERDRIDAEIARVGAGRVIALDGKRALEPQP
ncbi:hypothetical protein G6F68_016032 [Rhizopus microsporus]|nr:hypothetical protein G6F68_016032 [Rhizopus microsporus]